ncbi:MAG TPA: hypothetical protein GXX18_20175, partial [Bacillales bacterium]|nr:hypothetical protein [Bacillales bacterium]
MRKKNDANEKKQTASALSASADEKQSASADHYNDGDPVTTKELLRHACFEM